MHRAALLAFLLSIVIVLSGCAGKGDDAPTDGPPGAAGGGQAGGGAAVPYGEQAQPMRFAAEDAELSLAGSVTFPLSANCIIDCTGDAVQEIDLTSIVPADAPVELSIVIDGDVQAHLEFTQAAALQETYEFTGNGEQVSAIVVRAAAGTVTLVLSHTGIVDTLPDGARVSYAAGAAVRGEKLLPHLPAAVHLEPGDVLNVTGDDLDEVLLIGPDGVIVRDERAPFLLEAHGGTGEYVVLALGDEAATVYGPNATFTAKRLAVVETDPRPLSSGSTTTFTLAAATVPLQVGVRQQSMPAVADQSLLAYSSQRDTKVTAPSGAVVIDEHEDCVPICGITAAGGTVTTYAYSEFLDPGLVPGDYQVAITWTGANMQAVAWALVIA